MAIDSDPHHADMPSSNCCLVVYNPKSGRRRRRKLDAALTVLRSHGIAVDLAETAKSGDSESMARDAKDDVSLLVVAGGDGTIRGAVQGLVARAAVGRPMPPLGVLPLGTANVLAGELGMPPDPAEAALVLADGVTANMHLGWANGHCFTMMASVGFDSAVVARGEPRMKGVLGKSAYVPNILRELAEPQGQRFQITIDGEVIEAAAVILANGRCYGGRFVLAPNASLAAPELQACLFLRSGRLSIIRYAAAIALGLPERWGSASHRVGAAFGLLPRPEDFRVVPAKDVTVTGPESTPVQGDGDKIGYLPLVARMVPGTLQVIVPAGSPLVGDSA